MKRRGFLLTLTALASGCGGGGSSEPTALSAQEAPAPQPAFTAAVNEPTSLRKLGRFSPDVEASVIVWNGELLVLSFIRDWSSLSSPGSTAIRVRRWSDAQILAEHQWPACMGCAFVHNGVIHVFGSTDLSTTGNKIVHSTLAPDFAPSAPIDALLMNAPSNPFKFYNTEVCADSNGFRMVVETTAGVYFARSPDLTNWTFYGGQFNAGSYVGCPTLDYVDGAHHLTWLAHDGGNRYITKTAKSEDDCFTFHYGKTILAPAADEGSNNSDVAFQEFGGCVYGLYLDGDQATWGSQRKFTYDGSLAQMFAAYA